jgi:AcrR family transcriptional regulator
MARTAAPDTRERVLSAAAELFYTRGVRAVGMQEIVDTAGCGKNLLYREFPSKADLVKAYLDAARRDWERGAAEASQAAPADPASQLIALVQAMADHVREIRYRGYRGCPFRNYLAEAPEPGDPGAEAAIKYLQDTRARVDALVSQLNPSDPSLVAERIWLITEGLYSAAAHPGGAGTVDAAVLFAREIIDSATR